MGFFDKKYCDICGEKIGLLGNRKLEDGNLCKNCAKKLSPWFDERRHSTVDQIKQQLAYREANRSDAAAFRVTRTIGRDNTKLYIDDNARKFAVYRGSNFAEDNPDILDFSQALGCDLDIREDRDEIRRTVDGRSESYNPPRYEYSYDFKVTIRVNHPYFNEMSFDLNGRSVHTGETQMSVGNAGAWNINRVTSFFGNSRGANEYNEFIEMGNEVKAIIDGWKNGGSMNTASQQSEKFHFGGDNSIPYTVSVNGTQLSVEIAYSGECIISSPNPAVVNNFGGLGQLKDILRTELITASNEAVYQRGAQGVSYNRLPTQSNEIAQEVKSKLAQKWANTYGLQIESIIYSVFTLTKESIQKVEEIFRMQQSQTFDQQPVQEPVQPVQPQTSNAFCPFCGTPNPGKFCPNCGAKQ